MERRRPPDQWVDVIEVLEEWRQIGTRKTRMVIAVKESENIGESVVIRVPGGDWYNIHEGWERARGLVPKEPGHRLYEVIVYPFYS